MVRKSNRRQGAKTLHFKNKEEYRKWNAYRNIYGEKHPKGEPYPKVVIHGKPHKVKHKKHHR